MSISLLLYVFLCFFFDPLSFVCLFCPVFDLFVFALT